MSRPAVLVAAVLLGAALIGGASRAARARAAGPALALAPTTQSVAVSASGNVDVTVASVTNLGGYHAQVTFNPAVLHVTAMSDAGFVTSGSNVVVCNPAVIDNTGGTAALDCATVNVFGIPGPGVSTVAATPLAHVAFTAVAAGASPLALASSTLEDPAGAPITATLGTGSVTVTGASAPPAKVGGIAQLPDAAALPPRASSGHGGVLWLLVLAAFGVTAAGGALVLVARRR